MSWSSKLFKRILKGTVVFILPVMLMLFLLKKAVVMVRSIIHPLKEHLPVDAIFGIGMITLLSILVIAIIAYIAGLWAEKRGFKSFLPFLENKILIFIPGYTLLKSRAEEVVGEDSDSRKAVMVGEEGDWKFGIEIENHPNGYSAVFFPEPPDGKAGEVKLIHTSKLTHVAIPAGNIINIARTYGKGSGVLTEKLKK